MSEGAWVEVAAIIVGLVVIAVGASWRLSSRLSAGAVRFENIERRLGGVEDEVRAIASIVNRELNKNGGQSVVDKTQSNNEMLQQILNLLSKK